jgi:hypothetical protein
LHKPLDFVNITTKLCTALNKNSASHKYVIMKVKCYLKDLIRVSKGSFVLCSHSTKHKDGYMNEAAFTQVILSKAEYEKCNAN